MRNTDLDYTRVESLEEFVNLLKYGDLKYVEIEEVPIQALIIEHLSSMLNKKTLTDRGVDEDLFIFSGVEQFLIKLTENLDSTLEPQAKDLFQHGCSYVAGFIGTHPAQHVLRRLLKTLGDRFPNIQALYEQQFNDFIEAFFEPTIGEFFDENSDFLKELSKEFPIVYELFVKPLTTSTCYNNRKLFNYYCNPCIYNPIIDFVAKQDRLSERRIRWLEDCLQAIRPYTNEESWQELANKSRGLNKASKDLESFTQACSGLLGEIKTAFHLSLHECHPGDTLIFLEGDNSSGKKVKEKNCDLMVISSNNQKRVLVEVKTKSPRHGVEEVDIGVWDNFFSNFSNSISDYLAYLEPRVSPICGLSLRKFFPLFFVFESSSYGMPLSLVKQIDSHDNPNSTTTNKSKSAKKIETLLRALHMRPVTLYPSCVPLASDDARLSERYQWTENVISKDWVRNTMLEGIEQLQKAIKRQSKEGHEVSKLNFALVLSLSYRLCQDPFSHNDGNIEDLAAQKLREAFRPFKDELSAQGFDIDLLLP